MFITDIYSLLPFQIISEGGYIRSEISVYGSGVWAEITVPITTVISEGFYIHSYDGTAIAGLICGAYEFRVIAGEIWWFEPFTVEDFDFTENAYKVRDLVMTPLKFLEQQIETLPLIAPCDSFLPFMYTTENPSGGSPIYTLVAADGTETALTITVDVLTIDGRTYYIHDGACFYPFLTCGEYYIRINDGAYVYYSVPFSASCSMNDIPDGYRAMRDFNGCVMRDEDGDIIYESCMDIEIIFETDGLVSYILGDWSASISTDGTEVNYSFTITGLSSVPANISIDLLLNGVSENNDSFTNIYNGVQYTGVYDIAPYFTPSVGDIITFTLGGES